ncbi:MAG: hypothetical protein DMF84_09955 [Acidobacteria bacterium]|nr:MAG: hypothetical protein DMF84_09955 [Acidobacteriota bacterium]
MNFRLKAEEGTLSIMKAAAALFLLITCSVPLISACASSAAVSRTIDDATITTRVKTALLNDTVLDATKIDVDTSAGVVTLKGVVKSKEEEMKAIELTRHVSGVRDVKSALQIQSGVRSQDASVRILSGATPSERRISGTSVIMEGGPQRKQSVSLSTSGASSSVPARPRE